MLWQVSPALVSNVFSAAVLTEKRPELRGGYMLCFLDDGTGMDPSKLTTETELKTEE